VTGALSFWQAVRLVARREVVERSREKSFLVSTGLTLLIVLGVVVVPPALGLGDPPTYRVSFAAAAQDTAGAARAAAEQLDVDLEVVEAEAGAARSRVADGDLDAHVDAERIVVDEELDPELEQVLQTASRQVRGTQALEDAGLDPTAVARAEAVPALPVAALDPPDPGADARRAIVSVGTFVLYGQLLGYGFWVATGIVEEKSSRVVEVLLATVRPRALLAGKVLGIGLLALAQLMLIAVLGVGASAAAGVVDIGLAAVSPVLLLLGWFVLGFAFYACLFAAGAARVSRQEDLQSVTTPGTLLVLVSFFAAFYVSDDPDSTAARVLGVLPPFSALVAPVRTASGSAAAWEAPLAVCLMLLAVAGLVVLAARVYEGSVLRMGATVGLREALRGRERTAAPTGGRAPGQRSGAAGPAD
jgi:ABC-2 type transport system permease protein